jgi:hypothetical protein
MKTLKLQIATISEHQKKINSLESAIASTQAVLDAGTPIQDTASALEATRKAYLVRQALGENMAEDIAKIDASIPVAIKADIAKNASGLDLLKVTTDTLHGLSIALEAEQTALCFEQDASAVRRKAILKSRSAECSAIYEKSASQLVESLSQLIAIDAVNSLLHGDLQLPLELVATDYFKIMIPSVKGQQLHPKLTTLDTGADYFVHSVSGAFIQLQDIESRVNDLKRLLEA